MILTDDNFATIVKAVELGRGLFDNLAKYIRYQMAVLIGLVATFLGASIFNIVGGLPFIPLQTLYVNFTTQAFQAVGLGYGDPGEGLMDRKPRPAKDPILNRPLFLWLGFVGLVIGVVTLAVIKIVDDNHGAVLARTMGLTTFAFTNLFFSFATKDDAKSIFDFETYADRKFLILSGASLVAIVLGNELGILQRILHTEHLSFRQWLVCIGVGLIPVVVSEIRRVIVSRRGTAAGGNLVTPAPEGASV